MSLPARVAGMVPDKGDDAEGGFDPDLAAPRKDHKKMDRFILFALLAAAEAVAQAGWMPAEARAQERTATVIATGIGGFPAIAGCRAHDGRAAPAGCRRSPCAAFLANLAAGHISIRYGTKGAIGAPVTRVRGERSGDRRCGAADPVQ